MGRRDEVECWLTDMDGVLVHENHALPGAAELLQQWEDAGTPYLVLTNNSIFTARDLSARLRASGLHVPEDRIWTSALATADFLKQQLPGGTAFVIGEAGILTALHEAGFVMSAAIAPVAGSGPSAEGPVASGFVTMNRAPLPIRRIALVIASNE